MSLTSASSFRDGRRNPVHTAIKEKYSSINRIAMAERASPDDVDRPSYSTLIISVTKGRQWRQRHRSVLLHPMLSNANPLRHAASEKTSDDKNISHRPSLLLSSEESESLSLALGLCCAMIALGAFFKCTRSSSLKNENKKRQEVVNRTMQTKNAKMHYNGSGGRTHVTPPNPIDVKKLMEKRVLRGLSRGKIPSKYSERNLRRDWDRELNYAQNNEKTAQSYSRIFQAFVEFRKTQEFCKFLEENFDENTAVTKGKISTEIQLTSLARSARGQPDCT